MCLIRVSRGPARQNAHNEVRGAPGRVAVPAPGFA
jgi:hypothetical protein